MKPVVIVTGAARGIGEAIAGRLGQEGFAVARLDREAAGDAIPFDLADMDTHASAIEAVLQRHGRIDCVINNAGIASPARGDFLDLEPQAFDAVIGTNLRGTMFFTQAAVRVMLKAEPGPYRSVQFITSASAVLASPERLDYCVSKAGLSMFARGLALRLAGDAIDVFEIRPGIIRTDMTSAVSARYDALIEGGLVPAGRWGEPGDIASTSAALAAGRLSFATGSIIDVGGGLHIPRL